MTKSVKVQNVANPKPAAKKAFEWDAKNEKIISEAYTDKAKTSQKEANNSKFLAALASQVGAKSGQSVRSKLSSLGVYKALDKAATTIRKPRITKPVLADEIRDMLTDSGVDISEDAANSLANANADALKALIKALTPSTQPTAK